MNKNCGGPGQPPCEQLNLGDLMDKASLFESQIKGASKKEINNILNYIAPKRGKKFKGNKKDIKSLQSRLKKEGHYKGKLDGLFGKNTQAAYEAFEKQAEKEGLGDNFIPLNFKSLYNDLSGNKKSITKNSLGESEMKALQKIVRKNLKEGKHTIGYDDYNTDELPSAKGKKGKKKDKLSLLDKFTDPNYNLKTTVGQANIVTTPSDTLVVDSYDFNDAKKGKGSVKEYLKNLKDNPSLYNSMRGLGTNFGSEDGDGASVIINTNAEKQNFALGGKAMNIASPEEILFKVNKNTEEAKFEAMTDGTVQALNGIGGFLVDKGASIASAGIAKGGSGVNGFGKFMGKNLQGGTSALMGMSQMFGFGGETPGVPVEVEGEEVAETPNGDLIDFKGPSHENGGIGVALPEGTEIFSKRIKVQGKTMAERKKTREKKIMSLEKLLSKNVGDKVLKDTIKRTERNNKIEEDKDKKLQETISTLKEANQFGFGGDVIEYKDGGTVVGNFLRDIFGGKGKNSEFGSILGPMTEGLKFESDDASLNSGFGGYESSVTQIPQNKNNVLPGESKFNLPKMTGGDLLGMAGTLYSTFAPMENTKANRAGDTPNINAFKNYGVDGLETIEESKDYVGSQRQKALNDLELSKGSLTKRNRNSARGINTLRSLDMAANAQTNQAEGDIYDTFSKQMMGLLSKQAGFENTQDQIVMGGEQARDLADRKDRDNFFSQMAQDISTKGEGIQTLGKMFNQNKRNNMAEQAVNDSSVNFKYTNGQLTDKAGNLVMSPVELKQAADSIGVSVEEYINLINEQK